MEVLSDSYLTFLDKNMILLGEKKIMKNEPPACLYRHALKTLFNIVEAPFNFFFNFDVRVVWWCSDGPIDSQEYNSFEMYAVTIKISMTVRISPLNKGSGLPFIASCFFFSRMLIYCAKIFQNCAKTCAKKLVQKNLCKKTCAKKLVQKNLCKKTCAKTCAKKLVQKLVQKNLCKNLCKKTCAKTCAKTFQMQYSQWSDLLWPLLIMDLLDFLQAGIQGPLFLLQNLVCFLQPRQLRFLMSQRLLKIHHFRQGLFQLGCYLFLEIIKEADNDYSECPIKSRTADFQYLASYKCYICLHH